MTRPAGHGDEDGGMAASARDVAEAHLVAAEVRIDRPIGRNGDLADASNSPDRPRGR